MRDAVAAGAPLEVVTGVLRASLPVLWPVWLDAAARLGVDGAEARARLEAGGRVLPAHFERCSEWAERAYLEEQERRRSGRAQRVLDAVGALLSGAAAPSLDLGYDLDREHLGVVASGASPEHALRSLADTLGRELLSVSPRTGLAWGWLGAQRAAFALDWRRLERFLPPPHTELAVGGPAAGRDGFRRAHSEALQARRVAVRRPEPRSITVYGRVALEALAGADEQRARDFVSHALGDLAASDPRAETLRATLSAYFSAAQRSSSAAALLAVHEKTVANRLRAIEQHLGCSIAGRRAELETALRLFELLGPDEAARPTRMAG